MKKLICSIIKVLFAFNLTAQTYYVAVGGSNSLSTNSLTPGSITFAFTNAPVGSTVYVKAGNYGAVNLTVGNDNTKFLGYTNTPGDLTIANLPDSINTYNSNIASYPGIYPTLSSNRAISNNAIYIPKVGVAIQGFYINNYMYGISVANINHAVTLSNLILDSFGDTSNGYNGIGINLYGNSGSLSHIMVLNAAAEALTVKGSSNTVQHVKIYCDQNTGYAATDYYFVLSHNTGTSFGNNNLIENCYAERVGNLSHSGHGFCAVGFYIHKPCSTATQGTNTITYYCYDSTWKTQSIKYNTFRNCTSKNISELVLLRGANTSDNEFINMQSSGGYLSPTLGARKNKFINCKINNSAYGIRYGASTYGEVTDFQVLHSAQSAYPWDTLHAAKDNEYINCLFNKVNVGISLDSYSDFNNPVTNLPMNRITRKIIKGEKLINCTLIADTVTVSDQCLFHAMRGSSGNLFLNTIVLGFKNFESRYFNYTSSQAVLDWHGIIQTNYKYDHCNFYKNGAWQSQVVSNGTIAPFSSTVITPGINNVVSGVFINCNKLDPGFVNASVHNYHIQNLVSGGTFNKGRSLTDMVNMGFGSVNFDLDNLSRPCNGFYDVGVYEFQNCGVGIDLIDNNRKNVVLYPNPTKGILQIQSQEKVDRISIYSMEGKKIIEEEIKDENSINVSKLNCGIYLLEIQSNNGKQIIKFIKE